MAILVIDTALEACSVGLQTDDGEDRILSEDLGRGHAERLFPLLRDLLSMAGLDLAAVRRIGVTLGPGSFTGLRVGVSAARGLALVTGSECVGVSTLAAHAEAARPFVEGRPVLATFDSRRGDFYGQLFDAGGQPLTAPEASSARELGAVAQRAGAVLAGSGAAMIAEAMHPADVRIVHQRAAPEMAALLRCAARAVPSGPPRPLYLRPADARPAEGAALLRA